MDQFLSTETLVIELLLIVSILAIDVRRLRIPYTVTLVIVSESFFSDQLSQLSKVPAKQDQL